MPTRTRRVDPAPELAGTLTQLGFTDYEAKAYLALCRGYPATAYEVARRSGLPRANAYTVLRNLELKGAIQEATQNPVRYVPLDPREFFGQVAKRTAQLCSAAAERLAARAQPDESMYVWIYRGDEVGDKIEEMIAGAAQHVRIKAPVALLEPHLPALAAAARRGVAVILIVFGPGGERLRAHPRISVFPHEGSGEVFGASGVLLTMTVDCATFLVASYAGEPVASYARNQAIVYVIETLLLHEIYFAEIYAEMGPLLDKRYGRHLARLRKRYRQQGMEQRVLEHAERR